MQHDELSAFRLISSQAGGGRCDTAAGYCLHAAKAAATTGQKVVRPPTVAQSTIALIEIALMESALIRNTLIGDFTYELIVQCPQIMPGAAHIPSSKIELLNAQIKGHPG